MATLCTRKQTFANAVSTSAKCQSLPTTYPQQATSRHAQVARKKQSSFQPVRNDVPIYDIVEHCLNMIGAAVLIVEIVGVLPHIDT
jgi:hypothetical protein